MVNRPPRLIDAFIDRLIELAAGAEPVDRNQGLPHDIWRTTGPRGYILFADIAFRKFPTRMLDSFHADWSGPRGKRRRKLCYDVAVQAMASAGGYYGRYA